jgi:hypothetical protein
LQQRNESLGKSLCAPQVEYSTDPDHLLTPINGEGRQERALAERFFPTNFTHFDAARSTKFGLYGYVMITRQGRKLFKFMFLYTFSFI